MKKFLIVDGSSIFYRAFHAMPKLTAPTGEPTGAVVGTANIILKILRELQPDFVAVALDVAKKTFRNEIFPEYKATRPPMPDELAAQLDLLKEFFNALGLKTCAAHGYEADDIIGTLCSISNEELGIRNCDENLTPNSSFLIANYILTGDRDALQLIDVTTQILLYKNSGVDPYDEQKFRDEFGFEPGRLVDYKALCGDKSDNIPGVKGIGDKTAAKLIREFGSLENVLARRSEITSNKIRAALETFHDDAVLSKKLAQIVSIRNEELGISNFDDFVVTPDFARVDEFCDRYALNQVKKKIHELFNTEISDATSTQEFLSAPKILPFDNEKVFNADKVSVAKDFGGFVIKIIDGDTLAASRDQLQKIFDDFNGKIVLSNLKTYLREFTVDTGKIFDVELAAYLLYPERENYSCAELLPLEFDGMKFSEGAEVVALEKLSTRYETKLADADLTKLYSEIELPLTEVLADMERRGVFVDKKRLQNKTCEISRRILDLQEKIFDTAGVPFNLNSPKQLAEILFDKLKLPPVKKTKTGFSTNADVLEELKWRHPIVADILSFRALTKLKSTYLDGLAKLIKADGRIHTNFNQTVTATGRLSSSDPNLQNIPVRTDEGREIRALFEPQAPFDCIVSADYSQIELRLLAHMSGDKNLIDAFNCGQDIHTRTAAEVFGKNLDEITPDLRRKAKAVNFGIVYGISEFGLARDLHITRKEAGDYIARYFDRYPDVKNFIEATVAKARELGYVTTMFGRRRYLPAINDSNFNRRSFAERVAMNTPIQGSAADIIKLAMIRAENNLRDFDSRIIIQVHDELVLEAKTSELVDVENILRDAMENVARLAVPLVVDVHSGSNWSLAK